MIIITLEHCATCGAPIVWVITQKGKHMLVDADPVGVLRGFRLEEIDGENITAVFTMHAEPGERLYVSHFGTCPDADHHRRLR